MMASGKWVVDCVPLVPELYQQVGKAAAWDPLTRLSSTFDSHFT
jgi:hypothetical protein